MDLQRTQHYTTLQNKICDNLIQYVPDEAPLIEPFVGKGDLLSLFPNHSWETYDLEPHLLTAKIQDTLKVPPEYKGKWVITNPPYLAKNKALDKTIFDQYGVDDLYKAALISLLEAEGGILIIPANFFTDERTGIVRKQFLNTFEVLEINFFSQPVFESTTYSICSFAFRRKREINKTQTIKANLYPEDYSYNVKLTEETDYRIAGEFYQSLRKEQIIFSRLTDKVPQGKFLTNIKLFALDTRTERIRLEYCTNPFFGKPTDRCYATFVSDIELTESEQKKIIENFNKTLESFRQEFGNLSLTNYRDYNRKRIGFTFAYQLASRVYRENKGV